MEGSGSLLFRQLQAVGVGEKLLNPFWDIGKTVRVYFGCMRPNVLAFIHPQLIIKTQTYSLFMLRITRFMQTVVTPVAHGEYGSNCVSVST